MEWIILCLAAFGIAAVIYYALEHRQADLITSGEVCDKKHSKAQTRHELATYVGTMPVYKTVNHAERWTITFKKFEKSRWHTRSVDVSEETYKKYAVGDSISFRV